VLGAGVAAPFLTQLVQTIAPHEKPTRPSRSRTLVRRRHIRASRISRRAERERTHHAGRTIATASLALLGSLALRFLVTREGKRSAESPRDTWALTAPKDRGARCPPIPAHVVGEGSAGAGPLEAARVT
jgi:hypothetical protein